MTLAEQILTEARSLIGKGWCQGPTAVDRHGRFAVASELDKKEESGRPCAWCPAGALFAIYKKLDTKDRDAERLLNAEATRLGFAGFIAFNEHKGRKQVQVLSLFDAAIVAARGAA